MVLSVIISKTDGLANNNDFHLRVGVLYQVLFYIFKTFDPNTKYVRMFYEVYSIM